MPGPQAKNSQTIATTQVVATRRRLGEPTPDTEKLVVGDKGPEIECQAILSVSPECSVFINLDAPSYQELGVRIRSEVLPYRSQSSREQDVVGVQPADNFAFCAAKTFVGAIRLAFVLF